MGFYDIGWERMEHARLGCVKEHAKIDILPSKSETIVQNKTNHVAFCSIWIFLFKYIQYKGNSRLYMIALWHITIKAVF